MAANERVLRVSQLDVLELDEELIHAFHTMLMDIFQPSSYIAYFVRLKPEMKALAEALLWWLSVRKTGSTFGQEMLGLGYSDELNRPLSRLTRYLLFLNILLHWVKHRLGDIVDTILPESISFRKERLLDIIDSVLKLVHCVNFCSFLLYGIYPSFKERLLGLKQVPLRGQTLRQPSYDFMNREIIWYGFSEFLFFVLPEINFFALRNYFRKKLASIGISTFTVSIRTSSQCCSHCKCNPILPQVASGCGHVFCYYCIAANLKADKNYPCDICGKTVETFDHAVYE